MARPRTTTHKPRSLDQRKDRTGPEFKWIFDRETDLPQLKRLAMVGLTDQQIAALYGIPQPSFSKLKNQHQEIAAALAEGRHTATANVAHSLYSRAMGYSHEAVKILMTRDGEVVKVPYIEHYPPDSTACIFYLKNRAPEQWRDRQEHDLTDSAKEVVAGWAATVKRLGFTAGGFDGGKETAH